MTEKEKMIAGEYFHSDVEELTNARRRVKDLCFQYNNLKPSDIKNRDILLRKILGKTGEKIAIESDFWCDYGYNISVGNNFYMNHGCIILDCAKVTFGNNVLIAPNCSFYTVGHPFNVEKRNKWIEIAKPITVGNNVWLGGNVTVLPGVTIGDNVVIGAGSVVTKNIPSNTLVYGNPARVIREIGEEEKN